VARVYAALAQGGSLDGVSVLGPDILSEATTPQSVGPCPVLKREASFGLGFQCSLPGWSFGPCLRSFGHMGTGCSLGFADPQAHVGFGYVMNYVVHRKRSARCDALVDALYECL
jgi:CubicO group peptidase (beta-lactamase class C family)